LSSQDLYLDWATEWIRAYYDRIAYAQMRRDDGMALTSARSLVLIKKAVIAEAERRGVKSRDSYGRVTAFFEFAESLNTVLADEERRLLIPKRPRVVEFGSTNYPNQAERVAALIQDLDEANANRFGGVNCLWYRDKTVLALIAEGDPAVEPLLKVLEKDESILTRFYQRPVQEPVIAILQGILQTTFVDAWATTNELAAAGTDQNKTAAAKMRAYWRKFKGVPLEERWYQTLADERASKEAWKDAFNNVILPVTSFSCLPTVGQTPLHVYSNSPAPMRGESLRAKTNPSVTQLLIRHAQRQPPPQPVGYVSYMPVGSAPYYQVDFEWIDFAQKVGRWDPAAGLQLMRRQMTRLLAGWEVELRNPVIPGHWNNGDDICRDTLRMIVQLSNALVAAGDSTALEDYVGCLLRLPAQHFVKYADADFLSPLWRYHSHPATSNAAWIVFDPLASTLARTLDPVNGMKSMAIQGAGTPLSALPQFQPLLLAALTNKSPIGVAEFVHQDVVRMTVRNGYQTTYDAKPDLSVCDPDKPVQFRVCDYVASKMGRWQGMPQLGLHWRENLRDDAVEGCRKRIEEAFSSRVALKLVPTRANPSGNPFAENN
jgi:hypothetical protein